MTEIPAARSFKRTDEVEFGFDDMFFSRTDPRGVIEAFNAVFLRVSEFTADEVFRAPHKIVRHDDMPKGIFHLFWRALKSGEPVGAYVRNRTKTGRSYWVFAAAVPVPGGGYLSVRIKPSTAMFRSAVQAYQALRLAEAEEGLTPAASADRFEAMLKTLGHASYSVFQARAIAEEIKACALARGISPDHRTMMVQRLVEATAVVTKERIAVLEVLDALRLLPTNMRLISHRIERGNGPLSTLSERYGYMADSLAALLTNLGRDDAQEDGRAFRALFSCGAAALLGEAATRFRLSDENFPEVDKSAERHLLDGLARQAVETSRHCTDRAAAFAARLARDIDLIRRSTLALDSIRVMSRVEFGQMVQRNRDLATVIQRIDESHKKINAHLALLSEAVQQIEVAETLLKRHAA